MGVGRGGLPGQGLASLPTPAGTEWGGGRGLGLWEHRGDG